jgi:hypothetical protein
VRAAYRPVVLRCNHRATVWGEDVPEVALACPWCHAAKEIVSSEPPRCAACGCELPEVVEE